jgi:putative acetyltransferase
MMIMREEQPSDIPEITNVHDLAFKGTDESRLVLRLRQSNKLFISLVCEIDGKIVGHIAYSPISSGKGIIGLGLAPVGVLPSHQGQGIGTKLIEQGNRSAYAKGYNKIFVLGYPDYYKRFGFVFAEKYDYYTIFDPEGEHFMVKGEGLSVSGAGGRVDYCEAFDEE